MTSLADLPSEAVARRIVEQANLRLSHWQLFALIWCGVGDSVRLLALPSW